MRVRSGILLLLVAVVLGIAGCTRPPGTGATRITASGQSDLHAQLLARTADVEIFRMRGPFRVEARQNVDLRIGPVESYLASVFVAAPAEKAPLVILLHGLDNSKEDHAYQAEHLASWGVHAVTIDLPNSGPWIGHGRVLARIVDAIVKRPELVDRRVDTGRIILAGHSYGATAVAVALAERGALAGGVLLDPAGIGRELPGVLRRVGVPVMVLGADEHVVVTRNRSYFFRFLRERVGEISIRDATHEDAQYPAEVSAINPEAAEEREITFVSALTSSALSLAMTGKIDYAWDSFRGAIDSGKFFNARRK